MELTAKSFAATAVPTTCDHKAHQQYRNAVETLRLQMWQAGTDLLRVTSDDSLGIRVGVAQEAIERLQHGQRGLDAATVAVNTHFDSGRCKAVPA